jgi:aromatic ring-opening dioxygenase LigB subunit
MTIKAAFILPHGSLILDPSIEGLSESANVLSEGMMEVSEIIKKFSPELCLLITPHGISHESNYCLYYNQLASGTAEWDGKYQEFTVEVNIDCDETSRLKEFLQKQGNPVSTLTAFTPGVSIPLRWGEVVPLWFLKDIPLSYQIMTLPTRRYDSAKKMIPELTKLGGDLREYFQKLKKDVIIIVSADLSHVHQVEGPYGHKPEAEVFDNLVAEWIRMMEPNILREKATKILDDASCCGFTNFIILDELLQGLGFTSRIIAQEHPTYYGMLIATFTLHNQNEFQKK